MKKLNINGPEQSSTQPIKETASFENEKLKIKYDEIVQELTLEQQELTGIKRIRRKIITKGPTDLYEEPSKYIEQYLFLTEGRFPSYQTWNHVLQEDSGSKSDLAIPAIERFKSEGGWAQELLPLERILARAMYGGYEHSPLFQITDEGIDYKLPTDDPDEIRNTPLVYTMCASVSNEMWRDSNDLPFFIFGNKNRVFKDYVQQILSDPDLRKMLELSGWTLDSEVKLEKGVGESYYKIIDGQEIQIPRLAKPRLKNEAGNFDGKYSKEFLARVVPYLENVGGRKALESAAYFSVEAGNVKKAIELFQKTGEPSDAEEAAVLAFKMGEIEEAKFLYLTYLRRLLEWHEGKYEKYSDGYHHGEILKVKERIKKIESIWEKEIEDNINLKKKRDESDKHPEWAYSLPKFDTTYLKLLMEDIPISQNVKIPIVRHPKLKPLRWCHAEMMITKEDGKTNILFFETK